MRQRVAHLGRIALMQSPADPELFDTFARLRDRGFLPPAPLALPEGTPDQVARALARRTPDELEALAASLVALPDPASPTAKTVAELLIAAKDPRAAALVAQIAATTPRHDADQDKAWAALAELRLGIQRGLSPRELARHTTGLPPLAEAEALSRLITAALPTSKTTGTRWLVPVDGGRFVSHLSLAAERRPALLDGSDPLGALVSRLHALLPTLAAAHHPLASAELLLAQRRFDEADRLHEALDHEDRARLSLSRAELFEGATLTLAPLAATPLPDTDLERHLQTLTPSTTTVIAGALRERLGDRAGAARTWCELALSGLAKGAIGSADPDTLTAATGAVRLADTLAQKQRAALAAALANAVVPDEVELARSAELRHLAGLSLRLSPDPLAAARLFAAQLSLAPKAPSPSQAEPQPERPAETDPHHPASRLAAASDLLAEGRFEPAANILAALLRKAEPGTPERLFATVASALENDPPPDELLAAAQRALDDNTRAPRLIAALRRSATAAFALHEELLGLAKDPSRPDPLRLSALESWLNIWAETTTPPNPDLLATLRELEPALLTTAATAIGSAQRAAEPVEALRAFLDARFASPSSWSDALLELMLGTR